MVEEEDAVVLRDVKMRIGGAVENKATNKVIGAQVTSQPIISALEIDPETGNILWLMTCKWGAFTAKLKDGVVTFDPDI